MHLLNIYNEVVRRGIRMTANLQVSFPSICISDKQRDLVLNQEERED